MDDMTKRRKSRLQALLAAPPFNGSREAFLKAAGITKGRISQMLDPSTPFGERSAMNLAKKLARKLPELKDDRWFEREVEPSSTESLSYEGECTKITLDEAAGIKWDSGLEVPIAMPYAPERLRSAVLLIGSLLGALDDRSRKTIGNVLNDLAAAPDEASYFADIAVSAAKTQKPISTNPELERALRPRKRALND